MAKLAIQHSLGTAPDTYLYSLASVGEPFATIGSDDTLRLFDYGLRPLQAIPQANTGLTCLTAHDRFFLTAGRDGLIRSWDSRTNSKTSEISEPKRNPFSSIACQDHYIAAGTESAKEGLGDVNVYVYDSRNSSKPLRNYAESHTDTITQLAFHPSQPNVLLSASTDGLVSFFDISIEDEEDALQRVLNPRSAVHCAGFFSNMEVYIATMDEHFSIHSLDDTADLSILDFGDIRQDLNCTYVVDVISGPQPALVCGNIDEQTLELVELDRSREFAFGSRIALPGAHGEELVRGAMVLQGSRQIMTCGEDGMVRLWDL